MMNSVEASYGRPTSAVSGPQVVVIGDGIIGLAVALELARRGSVCRIVGARNPGSASGAAAGLLAPSLGSVTPPVRAFQQASLQAWPEFLQHLRPFDPDLRVIEGLIQLGVPAGAALPPGARTIKQAELGQLEPELAPFASAAFHPRDGAVDNVRALSALRAAASRTKGVSLIEAQGIQRIERSSRRLLALTADDGSHAADLIVIAAGAWAPNIGGLPRQLPIEPIKGQMLALDATPLRHAVYGQGAYVVPRGNETVVGATSEQAGFDVSTSRDAIDALRDAALRICPSLSTARVSRTWAGLRPATPDMLPILDRDPDDERIIYACGHSRNGILLAPATATAIASLALGEASGLDLSPFRVTRFSA